MAAPPTVIFLPKRIDNTTADVEELRPPSTIYEKYMVSITQSLPAVLFTALLPVSFNRLSPQKCMTNNCRASRIRVSSSSSISAHSIFCTSISSPTTNAISSSSPHCGTLASTTKNIYCMKAHSASFRISRHALVLKSQASSVQLLRVRYTSVKASKQALAYRRG